jgi:hypothetical protein
MPDVGRGLAHGRGIAGKEQLSKRRRAMWHRPSECGPCTATRGRRGGADSGPFTAEANRFPPVARIRHQVIPLPARLPTLQPVLPNPNPQSRSPRSSRSPWAGPRRVPLPTPTERRDQGLRRKAQRNVLAYCNNLPSMIGGWRRARSAAAPGVLCLEQPGRRLARLSGVRLLGRARTGTRHQAIAIKHVRDQPYAQMRRRRNFALRLKIEGMRGEHLSGSCRVS